MNIHIYIPMVNPQPYTYVQTYIELSLYTSVNSVIYCPVFVRLGHREPFNIVLLPRQSFLDNDSAIQVSFTVYVDTFFHDICSVVQ